MKTSNSAMPRVVVQSSSIRSVGYSRNGETLEIEFVGGRVYRYFGVPAQIHQRFIEASSKGAFLNRFIKGQFDCEKVYSEDSCA